MRALVLSGGGVKGAFQVGVLQRWIQDEGREYDALCGVSVGALNCAFLSQVPMGQLKTSYAKLVDTWSKVNNDTIRKSWFLWKLASLWKPSVYNSAALSEWVTRDLDPQAVRTSGRKLRVGSVCWDTGDYYAATEEDEDLVQRVVASASFPAFLSPIQIKGQMWTDGGVRNVTPLGEAIRLGADVIDIVMCSDPDALDPWSPKGQHVPGYALRAIDLLSTEVERTDLQVCGLKNDLAELTGKYRKVQINLVQPTVSLTSDSLEFNQDDIQRMIKIGYEHACKAAV